VSEVSEVTLKVTLQLTQQRRLRTMFPWFRSGALIGSAAVGPPPLPVLPTSSPSHAAATATAAAAAAATPESLRCEPCDKLCLNAAALRQHVAQHVQVRGTAAASLCLLFAAL
jgi:hypothetical protein